MLEKIKKFYFLGLYSEKQVLDFAEKGVIKEAEARNIISAKGVRNS